MEKVSVTRLVISPEEEGMSIGSLLRGRGYSRRLIRNIKLTEDGMRLDDLPARADTRVSAGQELILSERERGTPPEPNHELRAEILYEDGEVVVFDKPAGMPVHESADHRGDTLANLYAALYPGEIFRPINRLDRDTMGSVACGKTRRSAAVLSGEVKKIYYGLIPLTRLSGGRVCAPIAREEGSVITRCVSPEGQYSATCYRVIERFDDCALCEFILETGRTHQIRVHMAHIGLPLLGDELYGGDCSRFRGQALVCGKMEIISDGRAVVCESSAVNILKEKAYV